MKRRVVSLMIALTLCLNLCPVWALAAGEGTDGGLCQHHPAHTDECGYVPENPDACTFDCRICPVEDLIGKLPDSVSEDNSGQVQAQLSEIYALYDGLTADEQQQVDLSPCSSLQDLLDGMGSAEPNDESDDPVEPDGPGETVEPDEPDGPVEPESNESVESDGPGESVEPGDPGDSMPTEDYYILIGNTSMADPFEVSSVKEFDTQGYTYTFTGTGSAAILVQEGGRLCLTGTVISQNDTGVKVQSGGFLSITKPNTSITSKGGLYALDIDSDAEVHLSTGKYSGKAAAIKTAGDFADLLEPGFAYFDGSGNLLLPADAVGAKILVIDQCPGHSGKNYTPGTTTHTWTCPYCGTEDTEKCTFTFVQDGTGTCDLCKNKIAIEVDPDSLKALAYDETVKPANGSVTVTVGVGDAKKVLTQDADDADYTVSYSTRADVGSSDVTVTVTVNGSTYNGSFTESYTFTKGVPVLEWDATEKTVTYTGKPVEASSLPDVTININPNTGLAQYLQYSHRKQGETAYTEGLPTNVGTYDVVVSLPEMEGVYAVSSEPITLTIDKLNPISVVPAAKNLTYNENPQELVTRGELHTAAADDGAVILFSTSEAGPYSTAIPTGVDAQPYEVWYKVEGTDNCSAIAPSKIKDVKIQSKPITPVIEPSEFSYLYDGTKKDPKITVKDGKTVIDGEQYTVTWTNEKNEPVTELTAAGTYTATIKSVGDGNYTFVDDENNQCDATAKVEIVAATQDALKITGKPGHVYYGDTVTTLEAIGGPGNGKVTWSITEGNSSADINLNTGELTIKGTGSITVTAERTLPNYAPVSDTWTFTVEPKPVTAEVTIAPKVYDGTKNIADDNITAAVKDGDLVDPDNDSIGITGLTGTFDDVNVGTGKTVTLAPDGFTITGDTDKYAVSIPATAQADITPRTVTVTVTLSGHDLKTDGDGKYYYTFDGAEKRPDVAVTGSDETPYSAALTSNDYTVGYANNKNAGTATVTVTASAGGNYTFDVQPVNFEIRNGAAVLTKTPEAKVLTYDGTAQDLVTVGTATGGTVVYSSTGAIDSYSETIPQETDAGTYIVYYMVEGDANHNGTAPGQVSVTIKPKEITPIIALSDDDDDLQTGSDGTYSYVYDGNAKKPTVTVTGGVDANPIDGSKEYTVSYQDNTNAGTAKAIVSNNNGGNYIVNGTAYFEITEAEPEFTAPEGKTGLKYSGATQELVKAGVSGDGTVVYSVNGGNYSAVIPTAAAVGGYTITYKVLGDRNHSDTEPVTLDKVTIAKNTVNNPEISLSSESFTYDGSQQKPTITVYDDNHLLIPRHEYEVKIEGTNGNVAMVDVDTYTVTVTTLDMDNSNYVITANNTRTFEIVPANQGTISITGTKAQVRYGDVIQLGTTGGIGGSTVTWTVTDADGNAVNSTISATGLLTVKDVGGPITVTATCSAGGNYNDVSAAWEFSAARKPVTAIVTADDKVYDGETPATAAIHVTWKDGDLVGEDTINTNALTGTFDNPNVGQNKTVKITGGPITDAKYDITIPATTTASILAKAATVNVDPTPNDLTYDASQAQALVTAGTVTGGIMVYSLDGTNFTASIPTAKDAGTYTVHFKAQGDGNHTDSAVGTVPVTIKKQNVTPQIKLTPSSAQYDGEVKSTDVTLWDGANNVIPASEYKVTYVTDGGKNWTDKGDYTVKIENIDRGNYVVSTVTETFTINATAQNPLEITNKPGLVYYGDTFTLSTVGGSGNGKVTWSVDNDGKSVVEIDANGFVKIIGTGPAIITATKPGGTNYENATATYPLNALKKPVTAIVTADDKVYDGETPATAAIHVTWKDGDLVGKDTINTNALTGTFDNPNVGQNKTVTISGPIDSDKYEVKIPGTTTASILKADTTVPTVTANNRDYDRTAQTLVNGGDANTRYSGARDGVYSVNVPTGTNAGTYTVWYKELGDSNHNDSAPQAITVTISRKELNSPNITLSGNDLQTDKTDGHYFYVYDGSEKKPTVTIKDGEATVPASEYAVDYSNNKNVSTEDAKGTVTITCNAGGNYTFDEQTVNFKITEATAQLTRSPEAKDLTYAGPDQEQELVTVGTAVGGHIEYSLDGGTNYSKDIPTKIGAGTYTVTYKVVGEGNYVGSDEETWTVSVTIKPKEIVSPKVTVSGGYTYNGDPQVPDDAAIKVEDTAKDGTTTVIPADEYTVSFRDNVGAGTATAVITNANGGNYIVNGTGTFTIGKADVSDVTAPVGKENLPYNGTAQALAEAGKASGGTMVYSLSETGDYSPVIPAQTAVDTYTVWYKVQGDDNHKDTAPASVNASIIVNTVTNPTIEVKPEAVTYNGERQEPTVIVIDSSSGLTIDGSEYGVTYEDTNGNKDLTKVGTYTLTITGVDNGNYTFDGTDGKNTATFKILPADQTPLTITNMREHVYYGDTILLGTSGGNGTVTWDVGGSTAASIDTDNGLLTITGVGSVTVTATSSATGYNDQRATWRFYAEKKPATAVVTAESRAYNGEKDAAVTAVLQSSDLVNGDMVKIKLSGSFEDPNAGADKKVTVDSSNLDFDGSTGNYGNYSITYPATTTASIFKADVDTEKITVPEGKTDLKYTGLAQPLVTPGSSPDGTLEYSTDGIAYSASLPTGTDAHSYDVWYRVKGDGNHNDTAGTKLTETEKVTIAPQTVTLPKIEFTPKGASYDGAVHKPWVTVKDNNGRTIPDSEYTVDYGNGNWKDVGKYKVTITDKDKTGGNYDITETEAEFEILATGQSPLSITGKPGTVHYGDTFTLSAVGGSGTGTIKWEVTATEGSNVAKINQNGLVEVTGSGSVTITATKLADGNYGESTDTWTFSAEKKPVKAIVTAEDKEYDEGTSATIHVTWKDGDLLGNDTITLNLIGAFTNANVGSNKTVNINITGEVPTSDKYEITYNTTTTASITPKTATVNGVTAKDNLEFTGQPQKLVNEGSADSGNVMYSLDDGSSYNLDVPEAKDAGTYTVWYKAADTDENHKDSAPARVTVTIKPKEVSSPVIELFPEIFDYDGTAKKPDVVVKDGSIVIPASEYSVGYSNNTEIGANATVTIINAPGGNYTVSGEKNFTIKAGVASLKDEPKANNLTYNGFAQELLTPGTAVNGRVVYSTSKDGTYTTSIPEEANAGTYQVWYKVEGENGAEASEAAATPRSKTVTIQPKQVTPIVLVNGGYNYSTTYTSSAVTPNLTVIVEGKTLTSEVDYYPIYCNNTNPGTATVIVQNLAGNYQFYAVATFEITKAKAQFLQEPKPIPDLVYTGESRKLVKPGTSKTGGTVVYALDGRTYSPSIPKGIEVDDYVVFAKVLGDDTYADSDVVFVDVTISKNVLSEEKLNVTLSDDSLKYTGSELKPTVTVRDAEHNIISASEYSVTYSKNINVGQADVKVTSTTKNYSFSKIVHFTITDPDQPALKITGQKDTVYYGDTLRLGTTGGSGTVTWSVESGNATSLGSGQFKITGSGSITVKAETETRDSSDTWTFYADPKPVTAYVTAANKTFDNSTTATVTVIVNSGLAPGDTAITTVTASGDFTDANAGTDKTVIITGLTVPVEISAKYEISYPGTTTATIFPALASVPEEKAPKEIDSLTYTGQPQALVTPGEAVNGIMAYSLDGVNYVYAVPTGTDATTYTVWYKAVATDENHKDSAPARVDNVEIGANTVNTDLLTVLCTPGTFKFDGAEKAPTVVVRDSAQCIIPESEYIVTIPSASAVGEYTVTVKDKPNGNYQFSGEVIGTFKIVAVNQNPLSIVTDIPNNVHYGDNFRLSAIGGSGSGAIQWSIKEENAPATINPSSGVVEVTGTGGFTVQAYREAADGYNDSNTDSVPFYANPKPITAVATAASRGYRYNNGKTTDVTVTVPELGVTIPATGTFDDENVGTNKTVTIVYGEGTKATDSRYEITWPETTTASIYKVDAQIETHPQPNPGTDNEGLAFTGGPQPLVLAGKTVDDIGTIVYSTSQDGAYSENIPTGTEAGPYTVWYKVPDSVNYTGIPAAKVEVEIKEGSLRVNSSPTASGAEGEVLGDIPLNGGAANVPGEFSWMDSSIKPINGNSYEAVFMPNDTANYSPVTIPVTVTMQQASGSNNTGSTPAQTTTTIQNGTASTVVSDADGSKLVQGAVENKSGNVVIKPEITGDVTKAGVSIPSSTVSQLGSETNAALTVSSPVAEVTIPNEALDTLSQADGTVSVVTEKVGQSVVLTVAADGKTVEQLPGGLTLTVPVEDAGSGTVAVLIHDDGTRETIRKSVVGDGVMSIPLSGSATVEIVDNSKDFDDVPPEGWEAEAVDFASSHELFSGTSETTFSPDLAMTRGMLATVLYRLEGNPELDQTDLFLDVSSDAWYAEGVAWAAENGIAGGYGDGQFGPDDDITREQFVVMLWRYAGSPEAGSQALDFADADQASSFALEALCWAVENDILHGVGDGMLDPGGTATRAQAAQLLKNFMENT